MQVCVAANGADAVVCKNQRTRSEKHPPERVSQECFADRKYTPCMYTDDTGVLCRSYCCHMDHVNKILYYTNWKVASWVKGLLFLATVQLNTLRHGKATSMPRCTS